MICDVCTAMFRNRGASQHIGTHHKTIESYAKSIRDWCHICALLPVSWVAEHLSSSDSDECYTSFLFLDSQTLNINLGRWAGRPRQDRRKTFSLQNLTACQPSTRHEVQSTSTSGSFWERAVTWYEICRSSHLDCKDKTQDSKWYPTRLVELLDGEDIGKKYVRMIHTKRRKVEGAYTTLSHCWGSAKVLKLTCKSLPSFLSAIAESDLPRTFVDAIEVTRRFGIRYIWIDSLCIIQDSVRDWRNEAITMGKVYTHGTLNIAATASEDDNGGLFFERDPDFIPPITVDLRPEEGSAEVLYVYDHDLWSDGVMTAPLNTRAWVLQERLSAPRVLHFGREQLFWECHTLQACETFPSGIPSDLQWGETGKRIDRWTTKTREPHKIDEFEGYLSWKIMVSLYTRGNLTKEDDKLIAISGLARQMCDRLNDTYVAGLWRRHLDWQLAWFAIHLDGRPAVTEPLMYRAPSWSWASIDGNVMLWDHSPGKLLLEVLDVKITPYTDDEFGEIIDGSIRLRGALHRIAIACDENIAFATFQHLKYTVIDYSRKETPKPLAYGRAHICWDVEPPYKPVRIYYCLPHHVKRSENRTRLTVLLLEHNGLATGTYSRKGMIIFNDNQDQEVSGFRSRSAQEIDMTVYLQQLQEHPFDLEIPCEAYEQEHGYTISVE